MLKIDQANDNHAKKLTLLLRKTDREEIKAVISQEPLIVLRKCIAWSDPCYTIISNKSNNPLAIFGVIPDPYTTDVGFIWLLGTDELSLHSIALLRHSRPWLEKLHECYRILWNYVDARNEVHIRWLKWCGFTIVRRIEEYGVERRPFYEFERVASSNRVKSCFLP